MGSFPQKNYRWGNCQLGKTGPGRTSPRCLPALRKGDKVYASPEQKAAHLLDTYLPAPGAGLEELSVKDII